MPSVKIPRKSTATDMTPFVDVAFLILSFFMLATKFKPPEPVPIATPKSVSADMLKETNSVLVNFDSTGRVFFTMNIKKPSEDGGLKYDMIRNLNDKRHLNLSEAEMRSFQKNLAPIGVPLSKLKAYLAKPAEARTAQEETGIPTDSTDNQLADWIGAAKAVFYKKDQDLKAMNPNDRFEAFYMIKGDNKAKYPSFNGVLEAFRKNDQYSFKLVTDPEAVPEGSDLYKTRQWEKKK